MLSTPLGSDCKRCISLSAATVLGSQVGGRTRRLAPPVILITLHPFLDSGIFYFQNERPHINGAFRFGADDRI